MGARKQEIKRGLPIYWVLFTLTAVAEVKNLEMMERDNTICQNFEGQRGQTGNDKVSEG